MEAVAFLHEERIDMTRTEREKLEKAAGVTFPSHAEADDAQQLVDLVKAYFIARQDPMNDELKRLLKRRRQGRASTAELTSIQLLRHDESPTRGVMPRQWKQYALGVYVYEIEKIWREHGGKGAGSFYNASKIRHDGPLIRLLYELFKQAGIPEKDWPGSHTLHNQIICLGDKS